MLCPFYFCLNTFWFVLLKPLVDYDKVVGPDLEENIKLQE